MANISVGSAVTVSGTSGNDIFSSEQGVGAIILGKHTLVGGDGNDVYYVTSATTIVEQPNGGDDTVVSMTNYKLSANIENLILYGTSAGFGNDQGNMIHGSSVSNLIDGGKGGDSLFGGGGADTFQFDLQSGRDAIFDWNNADIVRLNGYTQFTSFAAVKAAMTQVGNDVVLKLDADDDITIANTHVADFTAANFQLPLSMTGLHLSFDDEFNGSLSIYQPSRGKNGVWDQWGSNSDALGAHTLLGNQEKELYVDPNFKGAGSTALGLNPYSVSNGVLSLTASPIPTVDRAAAYNYQYQSGAITTEHTFAQTYGYFEARMKLPTGDGSWPAFWLFRKDQVWPPELDIMEAWNDSTAVQTVHTQQTGAHTTASANSWVPDGGDAYHNYGFLWTATTLTWYIDGTAVFTQPTPADMHSPMYMIVNNAISGAVSDPNYTASLDVDYVRAYSLDALPAGTGIVTPDAAAAAVVATTSIGTSAATTTTSSTTTVVPTSTTTTTAAALSTTGSTTPAAAASTSSAATTTATTPAATTTSSATTSAATPAATPSTSSSALSSASTSLPATSSSTATTSSTAAASTAATSHVYWGKDASMPDGFNEDYYLAHNPDVVAAGMNPYTHYQQYGKGEGRAGFDATATVAGTHSYWGAEAGQPDGFNVAYYLSHNPDVLAAGVDPLTHYQNSGKAEGRAAYDHTAAAATTTSTGVTTGVATTATNPSSTTASSAATPSTTTSSSPISPTSTSLPAVSSSIGTTGSTSAAVASTATTSHVYWGKDASMPDGFNEDYYLAHNPDVVAAGLNPYTHYEQFGKAEGRAGFDATATVAGTHSYWGAEAGQPDGFNVAYYLSHNPDVLAAGVDPLTHYEGFGKAEGRAGYDATASLTASAAAAAASATASSSASASTAAASTTPAATTVFYGKETGVTDGFNAAYYALHNPDVVAAGMNLLSHYETYGKTEGRLAYDDGSGRETVTGTGGNDRLVAPVGHFEVLTGGAGNDTFAFTPGIAWDTVTDFDVAHDKLDVSALTAKYGAPTISALSWESGSMIHFSGGEAVILLGVSTVDAHHAVMG